MLSFSRTRWETLPSFFKRASFRRRRMRTILMARRLDPPPTASSTKRSMGTVVTRSIENQPRR